MPAAASGVAHAYACHLPSLNRSNTASASCCECKGPRRFKSMKPPAAKRISVSAWLKMMKGRDSEGEGSIKAAADDEGDGILESLVDASFE